MNTVLLFVHQLPQNLLGLLVVLITGGSKYSCLHNGVWNNFYLAKRFRGGWGVSLGNYIIFGHKPEIKSECHEVGHQKQSLKLGWLYLLIIGIPSFCGNIYARLFHKSAEWYYSQPWEHDADIRGGVER